MKKRIAMNRQEFASYMTFKKGNVPSAEDTRRFIIYKKLDPKTLPCPMMEPEIDFFYRSTDFIMSNGLYARVVNHNGLVKRHHLRAWLKSI